MSGDYLQQVNNDDVDDTWANENEIKLPSDHVHSYWGRNECNLA
jgi:hypothetical protein